MSTSTTATIKDDRIDRHQGVDAYGLYVEYIRFFKEDGSLHSQVQLFLTGEHVYVYQRAKGSKKARWTGVTYSTHAAAREQVRAVLAKSESDVIGAVMRGAPTLVQLTETDIEAIKAGEKPSARYDGSARNNRLFNKIDDDTWNATEVK